MTIPPGEPYPWPQEVPTDAPCPTWCALPEGHPFNVTAGVDADLERLHTRELANLLPYRLLLSLMHLEFVLEDSELPVVTIEESHGPERTGVASVDITPTTLRQFCALVLDAADTLDQHLPDYDRLAQALPPLGGRPDPDALVSIAEHELLDDLGGLPPTADNPCPSWCEQPPGHPYRIPRRHIPGIIDTRDRELVQDVHSRLHTHSIVDLYPWSLALENHQVEYLATGGHAVLLPAVTTLTATSALETRRAGAPRAQTLTSSALRQLAAVILPVAVDGLKAT